MTSNPSSTYARKDIWLVNFDPTIGDEIQKKRPAVIVSIHSAYKHKLQIVVPITTWQPRFSGDFWMIKINSTPESGLDQDSAANAYQVKSVSEERFLKKLGVATDEQMNDITAGIALCIGYRTPKP